MWAVPQDVIDSWIGQDAPTDEAKVDYWIGRAERLIRREFPKIEDRIVGGENDLLDNVKDVIISMVTRKFQNPKGYRSFSAQHTTGPFSGNDSVTVGGDHPGELYLTAEERQLIAPTGPARSRKAFSIMPGKR